MGTAATALGATASVTVGSSVNALAFFPSTTNINIGDSVLWTWAGTLGHSSTDTNPPVTWDSAVHAAPFTFSMTFNTSGTFPYWCTPHRSFGMTGSVIVNAASQPPSVSITNPANGSTFAAPWTGTLKAMASSSSSSVTNVQFFNGSTSLGNAHSAPFNLSVSNLAANAYPFTAVASDAKGLRATSSVINVSVVTPINIVLSSPHRATASQFSFTYTANSGLRYVIQRTPSLLSNFIGLTTNLATAGSISFTDNAATGPNNFYRVGRLPNP